MKETDDKEYSEMKKLLDDDELNKIAEPIFSYLKATLSIRNKNIDCIVDITNSAGYTSHRPRYAYPWGISQILLNCPEVKFSDLDYFIRAFSPYFLIKNVEKSYRYTTTKGKTSTSTATEKWIVASENSSFVKLLQHWDSKKPPQLKFPETVTILEAMRWYFCLNLLEQSKEHSPMVETEKVISKVTGKNQIPGEFMDFEKMFFSRDISIVNQIQPIEGERIMYVLGKCELFTSPSDSSPFSCDGFHSVLLDPSVATQLKKNITVSADDIKSSIILAYTQYVKEDPSNALPRKRAIASLKSQIGKEGTSAIMPSNLGKQEKDLLESEGWIKILPNGRIILGKGRTIREIDELLSELERELEKEPELWWNRVIEIRAKKETSNDKKSPDETVIEKQDQTIKVDEEKLQLKKLSEIHERLIESFSITSFQKGIDGDFLLRLEKRLRDVLSEFDIKCEIDNKYFEIGPRIIRANIKLGKGVRIQEIRSKSEDIANKLFSDRTLFEFAKDDEVPKNVQIESVPAKGMVGIYLPRNDFKSIAIRKILEEIGGRSNLEFPIGYNIIGESQYSNLESMPHLLVSGQPGSGKSVFLNSMIISLVFQNSPNDLKFVLIDPKGGLEFGAYQGLPHVYNNKIVENAEESFEVLNDLFEEMERRYKILKEKSVKKLHEYNELQGVEKLPYYVVIIDEFADLIQYTKGKDVVQMVQRLAQKGRAAGIFIVISTQRPSVKFIPGEIKAVIPSRLSFKLPSATDSKVILDETGAENLFGRGDMFLKETERPELRRFQGVFVSNDEINKFVENVKDCWRK